MFFTYLDSVNVFGGSHQTIYSKNFKGGEITAVFGGCDVNLTQADFEGVVAIDVTAIFGGAKGSRDCRLGKLYAGGNGGARGELKPQRPVRVDGGRGR